MTRYIEFFGMPGAGKTTACDLFLQASSGGAVRVESLDRAALAALLCRRGIPGAAWLAHRVPVRLRRAALRLSDGSAASQSRAFSTFRAQCPDFVDYLFEREETRISLGARDDSIVLLWLLRLIWWFQLAKEEANEVDCCVTDEGFSQWGLSLLAYRRMSNTEEERVVNGYFQCMPCPDTVVVPSAPLDVALERMTFRQQGDPTRMRGLPSAERDAVLERTSRFVELGAEQLRRRGVHVIRLQNAGSPGDLRRSVYEASSSITGAAGA